MPVLDNYFYRQCCLQECPNFSYPSTVYDTDKLTLITPIITGPAPYQFEINPSPRGGVSIDKDTGVITVSPLDSDFEPRQYIVTMKAPFCKDIKRAINITSKKCASTIPSNLSYQLRPPCTPTEIDLNYKKVLIKKEVFSYFASSGIYDTTTNGRKLFNLSPHFDSRANGYDYELVVKLRTSATGVTSKKARYSYTGGISIVGFTDISTSPSKADFDLTINLNETNIPSGSYVPDEYEIFINNGTVGFWVESEILLYQYVPVEYSVTSCDGNISEVVKTVESTILEQRPVFDSWTSNTTQPGFFNKRVNANTNVFIDNFSEYTGFWETEAIGGATYNIGGVFPAFYYDKSTYQNNTFDFIAEGSIPGTELNIVFTPSFNSNTFPETVTVNSQISVVQPTMPEDIYTPVVQSQTNPANVVGRMTFKNSFYIPGAEPVCRCPDEIKVNESITLTPTITNGSDALYFVNPKLPDNLVLNVNTGVISGSVPTTTPLTTYTITAKTCKGSTSFDLIFRVR